jgi:Protein of unknown function (DUF4238)
MIVELNENLHTGIEDDFRPYLEAMISGSVAFLDEPAQAAVFYRGLAVQYARTNHIRQSRLVMDQARRDLYLRVANPLIHMVGINVGRSLFAERKRHRVVVLHNTTDVPFVTADQPVINIAAGLGDLAPPEKFELYYPLSPTRAMLLIEPRDAPRSDTTASEIFIRLQNLRMAAHSYRQVFSSTPQVLESIIQELPA